MPEPSSPTLSPLSQALGRVASGLYVMTVRHGGQSTGMLASWVQQAGFEPPMITIAIGSGRYAADWVAASGRLTLNQVPAGGKALIRHFGRGFPPDAPAFEGLAFRTVADASGPVLDGAMAYLEAEVAGEIASGDHRVFLGRVIAGAVFDAEAEPILHVRKNGFHY